MRRLYLNIPRKIIRTQLHRSLGLFSLPYKVTFISTYKCNSRCKTCNVWKIYRDNPEKYKEELDYGEMLRIIDSMRKEVLWLNFTGGEPILKEGLSDLIKKAYDICKGLSVVNIPTNGLLPEKEFEFFNTISRYCRKTAISATL